MLKYYMTPFIIYNSRAATTVVTVVYSMSIVATVLISQS